MEPRFFSILGLFPTRERAASGLNDPPSHRDDEQWRLGDVPDTLVAAFRASTTEAPAAQSKPGERQPTRNALRFRELG